jgi:hypothetical protein
MNPLRNFFSAFNYQSKQPLPETDGLEGVPLDPKHQDMLIEQWHASELAGIETQKQQQMQDAELAASQKAAEQRVRQLESLAKAESETAARRMATKLARARNDAVIAKIDAAAEKALSHAKNAGLVRMVVGVSAALVGLNMLWNGNRREEKKILMPEPRDPRELFTSNDARFIPIAERQKQWASSIQQAQNQSGPSV